MSISDISPIGLPQSLKYDQLPSISDSVFFDGKHNVSYMKMQRSHRKHKGQHILM